jgi:hypothetical protein
LKKKIKRFVPSCHLRKNWDEGMNRRAIDQ